jgi:hypothetical protein
MLHRLDVSSARHERIIRIISLLRSENCVIEENEGMDVLVKYLNSEKYEEMLGATGWDARYPRRAFAK